MNRAAVTILGQLVHNEVILGDLKRGGSRCTEATAIAGRARSPRRRSVLITAHGISDRQRLLLESAGKTLIDTTCPLVMRAHQAARALQAQGYHVLVIGRKAHVEVLGIIGDLRSVNVIESELDVRDYARPRLGVVCQTTVTERQSATIRSAIAAETRTPRSATSTRSACRPRNISVARAAAGARGRRCRRGRPELQ